MQIRFQSNNLQDEQKKNIMNSNALRSILISVACILSLSAVKAQQSYNASSGKASGINGTAAFSVGEVFYTTIISNDGIVAQGMQHAYEILILGNEETGLNISLSIYPNPTTDNITLQLHEDILEPMWYFLMDFQGKILLKGKVFEQTQIEMQHLPAATYFVNVVNQENKRFKSFRIVKN